MFPTDLKQIAMATIAVLLLMAMRVPAVLLSTRSMRLGKKEFWFLCAAIPRGLAAGVLATLPMQAGVPGAENLAPAIFAVIVLSVLVFAIGYSIVGRMPDDPDQVVVFHDSPDQCTRGPGAASTSCRICY